MTTMLNIKKGERYNHSLFGKVTVTDIKRNEGEKAKHVQFIVVFKDVYGFIDTQGISGFKESIQN